MPDLVALIDHPLTVKPITTIINRKEEKEKKGKNANTGLCLPKATHTHTYIYIFGVNQHIFIVSIVSPPILCKSNTLVSNVLI